MEKKTILIVEDDVILGLQLKNMLVNLGYNVPEPVATGEAAIAVVAAVWPDLILPDLILMDIQLAGEMDGITAAERICSVTDVPVVFLTAFSQDPLLQRAKAIAPYGYLIKPVSLRELTATLEMALYKHLLDRQLKEINNELCLAQVELNAARARYFKLYDLAPVGYCTLSEKGLILEANLTATTLLGVAKGALIKQPITWLIHPDDHDIWRLHRKQLIETGEVQECELRMLKNDGTVFWTHLATSAAHGAVGEPPVYSTVMSDIVKRKRMENELKEAREDLEKKVQERTQELQKTNEMLTAEIEKRMKSEETLQKSQAQYRLLSEHTTDAVWLMDMNLNIIYHSSSVEMLRGFTVEEVMGIPFEQRVAPESLKLAFNLGLPLVGICIKLTI